MKKSEDSVLFNFDTYIAKCQYARDHGIENSFYTAFENMLDSIFTDHDHYRVISNPRSEDKEGHADFQVNRDDVPFLRIEAKPPKYDIEKWLADPTCSIDAKRLSMQLHKYRRSVDMILIVTDFKTIWWIDAQEMHEDATRSIPILYTFHFLNSDLALHSDLTSDFTRFTNLLYLDLETARTNVMDLLDHLMPYIKRLRDELTRIQGAPIGMNEEALQRHMREILDDFKKTMFKDDTKELQQKFTDLYTQVVAYGMFMAWIRFNKGHRAKAVFTIDTVSSYLPSGSLMQDLFGGIKDHLTPDLIASVFEPMEKWFNKTEYGDIAARIDDLMNEFYSGFLEKYDAKTKKKMGVVYTHKEVVDFMVRAVDHFLTHTFTMKDGILDPIIKYLDPSAGTMAYPCSLMELARKKIDAIIDADPESFHTDAEKRAKFSAWFREAYLRKDDRLSNVFGFEILMAPYILGSLRVLMTAEKLGADIDYSHDKVQMYLMNTLMDYPVNQSLDDFLKSLENPHVKDELREGLKVRKKEDIMVLLTNPPYNVSSQNSSEWITGLVDEYSTKEILAREEGKPISKKISGLKSVQDDYWKFLRFAQWKIEGEKGNRHGIVAYITNNFYIDGLSARGLRKEYRKAFDEIWIVDLHGDWKKSIPERADVISDENIFNIDCGVAIIFAIRYPVKDHAKHKKENQYACDVRYHELWGSSKTKLEYLRATSLQNIQFVNVEDNLDWELTPYIQVDIDYNAYPYLCDIFQKNIVGTSSGHDDDLLAYSQSEAKIKINELYLAYTEPILNNLPSKTSKMWNPKNLLKTNIKKTMSSLCEIVWRGFDKRWFCSDPYVVARNRWDTMQYMLDPNNLCIVATRMFRNPLWNGVLISNCITDNAIIEGAKSGGTAYIFPLKINYSKEKDDFNHPKPAIHSNLNSRFMAALPYWNWKTLSDAQKMDASTDVFYYIYGVLYSPTYREAYKGLLSKDFPRIPFPDTETAFHAMSILGRRLAGFHLMTDPETSRFGRQTTNITTLTGTEYRIGKYNWLPHNDDPTMGDLWFNARKKTKKNEDGTITITYQTDSTSLMIQNVPKKVWEFEIGGIMQLDQWLGSRRYDAEPKKDHLTRGITQEELKYFLRVINAITDTLALLPELDAAYRIIADHIAEIVIPPAPTSTLL